jgi:hypothetical protein
MLYLLIAVISLKIYEVEILNWLNWKWGFTLVAIGTLGLLLSGCGEDDSSQTTTSPDGSTTSFSEDNRYFNYEKICVENNKPLVETTYQNCMNLAVTPQMESTCATNRSANYQKLQNGWEEIKAGAHANYSECTADFRVSAAYCIAGFERYLDDMVSLKCAEYATYY